jgi:hypothetical protein
LNIQITKLLSVFSGKKPPPPQYDAAAAAIGKLAKTLAHSGQVNMAVHCVNVCFLVPGPAWAILTHAKEWQHSNIANLQLFSFQEETSRQTQPRKSVDAELTNCKNSGSPEEKKFFDMYTIVCASIDKLNKLSALDRIARAAVFLQIKSNDSDKYTFVCVSKIVNEISHSLLPVRCTELLMCANNVLDRTAKVAV